MSDEKKKNVQFLRKGKADEYKAYPTIEKAIADRDPSLGSGIYQISPMLIGTVKWCMVPTDKEAKVVTSDVIVEKESR